MEYMSVKETAKKWGIDTSRVGQLVREGRIEGAKLVGHNWLIPAEAQKPVDERKKKEPDVTPKETLPEDAAFQFPSYFVPSDSKAPAYVGEELTLQKVCFLMHEYRFSDAKRLLGDLPEKTENRYYRLTALYFACLIAMEEADVFTYRSNLEVFERALKADFPRKKEMQLLYWLLKSYTGENDYFMGRFSIDPTYDYHPSAVPFLKVMSIRAMQLACNDYVDRTALNLAEMTLQTLEADHRFPEAQAVHITLGLLWSKVDTKKAVYHFRSAFRLANDYRLFYNAAFCLITYPEIAERALLDFPPDFVTLMHDIAGVSYKNYLRFAQRQQLAHLYVLLPKQYFPYVNCAMNDMANKEVADYLGVSESTVNNRYSEIYDILQIKGKLRLKQFFINCLSTGGEPIKPY